MNWFPINKDELEKKIEFFLQEKPKIKNKVNGIIVPHAGYEYSGKIAGKVFSVLPKTKKAIVLGPSHEIYFRGIKKINSEKIITPFGKIKTWKNNYKTIDYLEHSVINQIPFLQKLGFKEILGLVVGEINLDEAKKIARDLSKENYVFIFSTDLSHFLNYEKAVVKDNKTINAIENLEISKLDYNCACGYFPLLVLQEICKIKKWKPELIEYKNSGDISEEKNSVVGYASFIF